MKRDSNRLDKLKRRKFVQWTAAGAAVHTGKRLQWRLASSFPRGLDTLYGNAEFLARRLDALSGGRFRIHCYPAGEIVPGLQVLDAVQQKVVQIGHTAGYYYTGKNPALAFESGIPFGLTARQQAARDLSSTVDPSDIRGLVTRNVPKHDRQKVLGIPAIPGCDAWILRSSFGVNWHL